ncbi:hypothetical protein DEO72_LG10g2904 [Vigna unguiculata]|uniref:Uncharacterized protein n=1 Tax=Vigna unguiculata TaxID=3917 RepID=A0A4D6NE90_VIGUN|nr:hypothetical protein DEO72_LG10g2904 [Vigna unguiculata]
MDALEENYLYDRRVMNLLSKDIREEMEKFQCKHSKNLEALMQENEEGLSVLSDKEMLDMERERMDKTFKKLKICRMEREPKLERMKDHISELETGAKTVNMDNEVMIRDLSEKIENLK